jgi:uncharacterized protein (DUF1501 family)
LTRRDLLKFGLGTGAALAASQLGCGRKRSAPDRGAERAARYWVLVLLSGGHDTLYTTDPKAAAEVDPIVTLPTENRVTRAGELRLGPHFAPLARWAPQLTVVNGVQVRTVNHDTGQKQFFHLKTNIADGVPTVLDAIATHRHGQPLGVAYLSLSSRVMHSPAYFGTADPFYFGRGDVFEQAARARPDELTALAAALRRSADRAQGAAAAWREAAQTVAYLREAADFFERVASVPPLVPAERSSDYVAQGMAEALERTIWLLEHDLCCGVVLDLGLLGWDTHIRNEAKQAEMNGHFARYFDLYLTELASRRNRHGTLADRTVTLVGSELGRFPRQNDMLGKDHLPQTSFLISGPGLRAGRSFGLTGRRMEGLSIDYATGAPAAAGRVPFLDDLGTTLLHLAGLDPERYGYSGQVCRFLLEGAA